MEYESRLENIPLGGMVVVLERITPMDDSTYVLVIWGPSGIHRVTVSYKGINVMRYDHRTDPSVKIQLNKWRVMDINSLDELIHTINAFQLLEG